MPVCIKHVLIRNRVWSIRSCTKSGFSSNEIVLLLATDNVIGDWEPNKYPTRKWHKKYLYLSTIFTKKKQSSVPELFGGTVFSGKKGQSSLQAAPFWIDFWYPPSVENSRNRCVPPSNCRLALVNCLWGVKRPRIRFSISSKKQNGNRC